MPPSQSRNAQITLTTDLTKLRQAMKEFGDRAVQYALGSPEDTAFKDILAKNEKDIEALSKRMVDASKTLKSNFDQRRRAMGNEGAVFAKTFAPIVDIVKEELNTLGNLISPQGRQTHSVTDVHRVSNRLQIAARSLSQGYVDNSVTNAIKDLNRIETVISPNQTQTMRLMYGKEGKYKRDINKAIDTFGAVWQKAFDFKEVVANIEETRPEAAKSEAFQQIARRSRSALGKLEGSFFDVFQKGVQAADAGVKNVLPPMIEMMQSQGAIITVGNSRLNRILKGQNVDVSKLDVEYSKQLKIWEARGSEIADFAEKSGIPAALVRMAPKNVLDKAKEEAAYLDRGDVTKQYEKMAKSIRESITGTTSTPGLLDRYSEELKISKHPEGLESPVLTGKKLESYVSRSAQYVPGETHPVTMSDSIDELIHQLEIAQGSPKKFASIKKKLDNLIVKGEALVRDAETSLSGVQEYRQAQVAKNRRELEFAGITQPSVPVKETITPVNVAGGAGSGDGGWRSSGEGTIGGRSILEHLRSLVSLTKEGTGEFNTLKGVIGNITGDIKGFSETYGITENQSKAIVKTLTGEMAQRERLTGELKSTETILAGVKTEEDNINNAINKRVVYLQEIEKYEKEIATLKAKQVAGTITSEETTLLTSRSALTSRLQGTVKGLNSYIEPKGTTVEQGYADKIGENFRKVKAEYDDLTKTLQTLQTTSGREDLSKKWQLDTVGMKAAEKSIGDIASKRELELTGLRNERSILNEISDLELKIKNTIAERAVFQSKIAELDKITAQGGKLNEEQTALRTRYVAGVTAADKFTGADPAKVSVQQKINDQWSETKNRINEASQAVVLLKQKRDELNKSQATMPRDVFSAQSRALDEMVKKAEALSKGYEKSLSPLRKLETSIKGIVSQMVQMAEWQAIWYASKFFVMGVPQVLGMGVAYAKSLDEWNNKMLRWGATSGEVTDKMRSDVTDLGVKIRSTLLDVPAKFEETANAVQGLIGAGLKTDVVKGLVKDMAVLKASFPEIDIEQFSIALVSSFNVFRDDIKGATTDVGKFRIILEQLLKAQAESVMRPEQFTKVMQYMSEIGRLAGYSTEQIFAMSTALADTGISAANASRLLGTFITVMQRNAAQKAMMKLGITLDMEKPPAEVIDTMIRGLREKLGTGPAAPARYFTFFQQFMPQQEIKILLALMDKWEEIKDRAETIKGATGGIEALNKVLQGSIVGQLQLISNTLKELGAAGDTTRNVLADFVRSGLDAARGALLAVNPELTKNTLELQALGTAGSAAYGAVSALKSMFEAFTTIGGAVLAPIKSVLSLMVELKTVIELITDLLLVRFAVNLGRKWAPGIQTWGRESIARMSANAAESQMARGWAASGKVIEPSLRMTSEGIQPFMLNTGRNMTGISGVVSKTTGAFRDLASGVMGFIGPWGLAMAGISAGLYLWNRNREALEANETVLRNLRKELSGASNSLTDLTDNALEQYIIKANQAAEAARKLSFWQKASATTQEPSMKQSEFIELVSSGYDTRIALLEKEKIKLNANKEINVEEIANLERRIKLEQDMKKSALAGMPKAQERLGVKWVPGKGASIQEPEISVKDMEAFRGYQEMSDRMRKEEFDKETQKRKVGLTPERPIRQFGAEQANLLRSNITTLLQIVNGYYDMLKEIDDANYQLGFESAKTHYDKMKALAKVRVDVDLKAEVDAFKLELDALEMAHEDAINALSTRGANQTGIRGRERDTVNYRGMIESEDITKTRTYYLQVEHAVLEHINRIRGILARGLKGPLDEWIKYYNTLRALDDNYNKLQGTLSTSLFTRSMTVSQGAVDRQTAIMDDLYNRYKISATEWYGWKKQVMTSDYDKEVLTAQNTLNAWRESNKQMLDESKGFFETFDKLKKESPDLNIHLTKEQEDKVLADVEELKTRLSAKGIPIPPILETTDITKIREFLVKPEGAVYEKFASAKIQEAEQVAKVNETITNSEEKLKTETTKQNIEMANNIRLLGEAYDGTAKVIVKSLETIGNKFRDKSANIVSAIESIASSMETSLTDALDRASDNFGDFAKMTTDIGNVIRKEMLKVYVVKPIMGAMAGGWESLLGGGKTEKAPPINTNYNSVLAEIAIQSKAMVDAIKNSALEIKSPSSGVWISGVANFAKGVSIGSGDTTIPSRDWTDKWFTDVNKEIGGKPSQYDEMIKTSSVKYGVDPNLVKAIMMQESTMNPNAVSKKGALGLMQVMPGTAEQMGYSASSMKNPETNIDAGVRYLSIQLDRFGGDINKALEAYNRGPERVGKPGMPSETSDYITAVNRNYTGISVASPIKDRRQMILDNMYDDTSEGLKKISDSADDAVGNISNLFLTEMPKSMIAESERRETTIQTTEQLKQLNDELKYLRDSVRNTSSQYETSRVSSEKTTGQLGIDILKGFAPLAMIAGSSVKGKTGETITSLMSSTMMAVGLVDSLNKGVGSAKQLGSRLFGGPKNIMEGPKYGESGMDPFMTSIGSVTDKLGDLGDTTESATGDIGDFGESIISSISNLLGGGGSAGLWSIFTGHKGGLIPVYHSGGPLTPEEILLKAKRGEFVQQQSAVKKYGVPFMKSINEGTYEPQYNGNTLSWASAADIDALTRPKTKPTSIANMSVGPSSNSLSITVPIQITGGVTGNIKQLETDLRSGMEETAKRIVKSSIR